VQIIIVNSSVSWNSRVTVKKWGQSVVAVEDLVVVEVDEVGEAVEDLVVVVEAEAVLEVEVEEVVDLLTKVHLSE